MEIALLVVVLALIVGAPLVVRWFRRQVQESDARFKRAVLAARRDTERGLALLRAFRDAQKRDRVVRSYKRGNRPPMAPKQIKRTARQSR